jgi:CheY-like chemotaxis protein
MCLWKKNNMQKILIAEDEAVIAIELEKTLAAMGHEVVGTAGSGQQAIEMARRLQPDLILMDIVMPGNVDGIAAAENHQGRNGYIGYLFDSLCRRPGAGKSKACGAFGLYCQALPERPS